MSWRGFTPGLLFAAVAAAASIPAAIVLAPILGRLDAHALLLTGILSVYAAGLAATPARAAGVGLAIGALGLAMQVFGAHLGEIAIGLTAALAICRSGVLFRSRPARAALAEGVLGLLAVGLAEFLYGPTAFGFALALWGYLLVQSAWFLVPGTRRSAESAAILDPFEEADRRARALMGGA
ncbi:MAG: hypothetical protein JRG76_14450 [Deltaproteobacteria bacterium]|jgi:hypothetical protein|nr:hypothetical protein [Deltaproteobacteria bacterium]MBW2415703.1 hypothetical protein [Deltaproteobacteria bacterium]